MPQRRIIKASDLSGLFIYQDPKRGTVFYDILSRKGYVLTSSDVSTYSVYTAMLPLCMILSLSMVSLGWMDYGGALLMFLALMIIGEVLFRIFFFYKLPVAENWKRVKRENIILYTAKNFGIYRLLILIALLAALCLIMPFYAAYEKMSGLNLYATIVITAVTGIGLLICLIALIVKLKNKY